MLPSLVFAIAVSSPQVAAMQCLSEDAQVVNAVQPTFPAGKMFPGTRVVLVKVKLSKAGDVNQATLFKTSGDKDLDRAAINAAKASTYRPAMKNCKTTAGAFLFRAEFTADHD